MTGRPAEGTGDGPAMLASLEHAEIRLQVVGDDRPRLLHRQMGYTENPARAMFGEPEAVDRETQQQLTARAQRTARQAQIDEWHERRQAITRELAWLQSQRFHRDVAAGIRALERQLDRIDRRLRS